MAMNEAGLKRGISTYLTNLEREIETMQSKAAELRKVLGSMGIVAPKAKTKAAKGAKGKGKRIRRSPEQLKAEAGKIAAAIKAKGSAGASAEDLSRFNFGISLKKFMQEQGHPVTSKGSTTAMRYFVK